MLGGHDGLLSEEREASEAIYLPPPDGGENVTHILHAFVCDRMLLARQIARLNGGNILVQPPPKVA